MQTSSHSWSALLVVFSILLSIPQSGNTAETADEYAEVRTAISKLVPGEKGLEIRPSSIENMLEVRSGSNVFYVSNDGEFLVNGPLYALTGGENLTENRLSEYRKTLLEDISAIQPVEYPAKNAKQKITVVTDIDCPYCRHLHQELEQYHEAGLDIDYVMLPRSGKNSPSYVKTVNAICAAQPDLAITAAMNGETPEPAQCDHPIDKHMEMAQALGAASTPNIILPDGTLIRGYKTASELSQLLAATPQD